MIGKFQTSVEDVAPDLGQPEILLEFLDSSFGIELLAGEDIDIDVEFLREGMYADMALGNENKAGNPQSSGLEPTYLETCGVEIFVIPI